MKPALQTGEHQVLDFNHDGKVSAVELSITLLLGAASFLGAVMVGFALAVAIRGG